MSNYTFKVYPDPLGSSNNNFSINKVLNEDVKNEERTNTVSRDETAEEISGNKYPPKGPPAQLPSGAPFSGPTAPAPDAPFSGPIAPSLPFETPPYQGPPFDQMPPFCDTPPYCPIPPFEQLKPFESLVPLPSNPPYQPHFSFPKPDPVVPVLPGYEVRPVLAHAYVPWQFNATSFSQEVALEKGTMFPELLQPQGKYGPCEGPSPCRLSPHCHKGGGSCDEE
ncbi:MAG: spore coat associated protein CotJA [Peptococcia bacterium]